MKLPGPPHSLRGHVPSSRTEVRGTRYCQHLLILLPLGGQHVLSSPNTSGFDIQHTCVLEQHQHGFFLDSNNTWSSEDFSDLKRRGTSPHHQQAASRWTPPSLFIYLFNLDLGIDPSGALPLSHFPSPSYFYFVTGSC